jgi:hypothetical protein
MTAGIDLGPKGMLNLRELRNSNSSCSAISAKGLVFLEEITRGTLKNLLGCPHRSKLKSESILQSETSIKFVDPLSLPAS